MTGRGTKRVLRNLVAMAAIGGPSCAVMADPPQDAFWLDAVSGRWDEPAHWSTQSFYPENGVPDPDDTYRAIIGATGGPYTVLMDDNFATYTVSAFVLDSADATFEHHRGQLHVDTVDLIRGTYYFNGSGGLAALEDATVNIGPLGRISFATYNGQPDQATGTFRRCVVNGDLRLDLLNGGVMFEDSVDLNGDIYLDAPGSAAMFNGLSMELDHSTIYASENTTVEMFAVRDGFTLGSDARIIGAPQILARSGQGSEFRNEGEIHFTSYAVIEDLAFHNAGLLTIGADRTTIRGDAQFSNSGDLVISDSAQLTLNFTRPTSSAGRIAIAPGGSFHTTIEFEHQASAVSEFLIDPVDGSGWMQLADIRYESRLDGTLRVLVNDPGGFEFGDEYWLVRCPNYSGMFAELDLASLSGGLSFAVDYRSDGVYAVVVPAPAPLGLLSGLVGMAFLRRRAR